MVSSDTERAALQKINWIHSIAINNKIRRCLSTLISMRSRRQLKISFWLLTPMSRMTSLKVILGKGDPIAQWKELVKSYDSKGVPEAIKEVNDEVAKRGIK